MIVVDSSAVIVIFRQKQGYGDCFAFALAKLMDAPLLRNGDDFPSTEIKYHVGDRSALAAGRRALRPCCLRVARLGLLKRKGLHDCLSREMPANSPEVTAPAGIMSTRRPRQTPQLA